MLLCDWYLLFVVVAIVGAISMLVESIVRAVSCVNPQKLVACRSWCRDCDGQKCYCPIAAMVVTTSNMEKEVKEEFIKPSFSLIEFSAEKLGWSKHFLLGFLAGFDGFKTKEDNEEYQRGYKLGEEVRLCLKKEGYIFVV
jgi:hypothetical protein